MKEKKTIIMIIMKETRIKKKKKKFVIIFIFIPILLANFFFYLFRVCLHLTYSFISLFFFQIIDEYVNCWLYKMSHNSWIASHGQIEWLNWIEKSCIILWFLQWNASARFGKKNSPKLCDNCSCFAVMY